MTEQTTQVGAFRKTIECFNKYSMVVTGLTLGALGLAFSVWVLYLSGAEPATVTVDEITAFMAENTCHEDAVRQRVNNGIPVTIKRLEQTRLHCASIAAGQEALRKFDALQDSPNNW